MQRRWRLTVECHKLHNRLYFKSPNHETSRATLAPSSLFRVGKILIYANAYHKLHFATALSILNALRKRFKGDLNAFRTRLKRVLNAFQTRAEHVLNASYTCFERVLNAF